MNNAINNALTDIANEFLKWPLPESVRSDGCASIPGYKHRRGTNLLNHPETVAMVNDVVRPIVEHLVEAEKAHLLLKYRTAFDGLVRVYSKNDPKIARDVAQKCVDLGDTSDGTAQS